MSDEFKRRDREAQARDWADQAADMLRDAGPCTCETDTITEQILCQAQPYVHIIITRYDPACPQHWPYTKSGTP